MGWAGKKHQVLLPSEVQEAKQKVVLCIRYLILLSSLPGGLPHVSLLVDLTYVEAHCNFKDEALEARAYKI